MLLPVNCKNQATVNYSILNRFKPAYIYRFKRTCGDKLGSFNKVFKEYLNIKLYSEDNGYRTKTKRNIYHIPAMEEQCITISKKFVLIELDTASKGFFIQLLLLSQYGNIELIRKNIIKAIGIDTKTYPSRKNYPRRK